MTLTVLLNLPKVVVLNTKVNYEIVDRRVGDPACLICDNSFAKEYLGWTPKYLNVEEHISHAWRWMNKNFLHCK